MPAAHSHPPVLRAPTPQHAGAASRASASATIVATISAAGRTSRTSPTPCPAYSAIASIAPVVARPGAGAANRGTDLLSPPTTIVPATSLASASAARSAEASTRCGSGPGGQSTEKRSVRTVSSLPTEVWVMEADRSNQRRLATGDDPAWSPDGREVRHSMIVHDRAQPTPAIAAVSPDGGPQRTVLTVRSCRALPFSWSARAR